MAGVVPRTILVCAFPAVLSLLTFLWIRKKKKNCGTSNYINKHNSTLPEVLGLSVEARTYSEIASEMVTEDRSNTDMYASGQESNRDLISECESTEFGSVGKLQVSSLCENTITCSNCDDKVTEFCSDVTDHLAQLTIVKYKSEAQGMENNVDLSIEQTVLKKNHNSCLDEQADEKLSDSGILELVENDLPSDEEKGPNCAAPAAERKAPDIVIQPSSENPLKNGSFEFSDSKLCTEEQEVQTSITIESFESMNYSEMDDLIDSPPHSAYSDVQSEGSSDSGKGGSDIQAGSDLSQTTAGEDTVLIYEFELPQDLCGRLIGRLGRHVNLIKSRSGANVFIKRHLYNPRIKICAVEGNHSEIKNALELIRKRFPLSQFPHVNLTQVNVPVPCGVMVPETLQLHLPEGVTSDVILSSMVSAGHFFVQQPTHPTYPSLNRLDQCMMVCYAQMETPELPHPVEVGVICAAPMMGGWYRASVVYVYEDSEECDVKFVDYGGYSCVSISSLRQIRSDFMTLPFQASECYLANVKPPDDNAGWSLEACATFEELAQGQILQSLIVAHADDGVPYVHLYRIQGVSTIFINRELVNRGVAQWVEHQL